MGPTEDQARVLVQYGINPETLARKNRGDITTMMAHMLRSARMEAREKSHGVLSDKYKKQRLEIIKKLGLKPGMDVLFKPHRFDNPIIKRIEDITPERFLKLAGRKNPVSPTRIELLPVPVGSLL
ncbi:MAG: hypothetical protein HYS60_03125 [Candidatus Wildermuthbacteria bacterium]|nr:hypothetical protein [Candidatus Wildermuthbacteria bacterium]